MRPADDGERSAPSEPATRHGFRWLRLRRPPCGARAGQARLSRPRRRSPARSRRLPAAARHGRPDPCGPGQSALPGLGRRRGEGRRRRRQSRRHPAGGRTAELCRRAGQRSPGNRAGLCGRRHRPPCPGLRDRRRSRFEVPLCPQQGRGRGRRAGRGARRGDPAALHRVRAGGRFLQPIRRAGAGAAGPAAGRRRRNQVPARLRRRRRGGGGARGRRGRRRRPRLRTRWPGGEELPRAARLYLRGHGPQALAGAAAVPGGADPGADPGTGRHADAGPAAGCDQADTRPGDAPRERQCRLGGRSGGGAQLRSVEAIVPSYLWRFRKAGQFDTARAD